MRKSIIVIALGLSAALALSSPAVAGPAAVGKAGAKVCPPQSKAFGKTLQEWLGIYWRWYLEGGPDTVGNVRLLPLPQGEQIGGEFDDPEDPAYLQGEIDVDLAPGTGFVLPEFAVILEIYEDGSRDAPIDDDTLLASVTEMELTIDGVVVMNDANKAKFYVPLTPLDPPVEYGEPTSYGSVGVYGFQGVGFVGRPLPPGEHVIHLYEKWVLVIDGTLYWALIYDNTWVIRVGAGTAADPGILPPHSRPYGKTYGEWGALWQQWVFTTTSENCPVTDTTGEFALVNQSRPVYFLAGTFGELEGTPWETPNPVHREITIPTGVALCIPILNWGLIYPDDLPFAVPEEELPEVDTWEEAKPYFYDALNAFFDNTPESDMAFEVDGVSITGLRRYRAQSEPFLSYAPAENIQSDLMNYLCPELAPFYTEGWYMSVSDGYYAILAPLSAGKHTIHLRGGPAEEPFCDVYYDVTVKGGRT